VAGVTTPIVALDVPSAAAALSLVDRLGDRCRFYKVGNELFTSAGPDIVARIRDRGADVFLDLKFHDIPNSVAGGVRAAAAMGARLTTVHASGGSAMLAAATAAAANTTCQVLGVTVLTSLTSVEVAQAWGRQAETLDSTEEVLRLATLVRQSGAHGIVCSGREAGSVRSAHGSALAVLIPGVRPAGEGSQDQARVVTPAEAVRAGARYIVVGRPVTAAKDPTLAMEWICAEIESAGR
jgi:orotidine-5'-phosphate decarboxylase